MLKTLSLCDKIEILVLDSYALNNLTVKKKLLV